MQELSKSTKISNLRIMSIEEEEVQAKGIYNILNKIIMENYHKSRESFAHFMYRKPPGHQMYLTKIEPPHSILSLKQQAQRTEKEY
jgi:hypothetical protein